MLLCSVEIRASEIVKATVVELTERAVVDRAGRVLPIGKATDA